MSALSLPAAIRRVILDVGANTDPLLPPTDDAGALTLAFEPITFGAIAPAPGRLHVLPVSPFGSETWESAATECLGHCAACAQCRVISIGLKLHDCSWYSSCALGAQLTLQPAGFRSASAWPGAS